MPSSLTFCSAYWSGSELNYESRRFLCSSMMCLVELGISGFVLIWTVESKSPSSCYYWCELTILDKSYELMKISGSLAYFGTQLVLGILS